MSSDEGFKKFGNGDERLGKYAKDVFFPENEALQKAKELCHARSLPKIYVNEMDGLHLQVFTKMLNAKKVVEVGTLGGYSAICLASAMLNPAKNSQHVEDNLVSRSINSDKCDENLPDLLTLPKLFTLEINPKNAAVARENISSAGLSKYIEVIEGPALESLKNLEQFAPFDLVFIDADKVSYPDYARWAEKNLRVGGAIIADNTFAWGLVLQEKIDNPDTAQSAKGIKDFNKFVADSPNFVSTILPTGEGLTVAVKISES